MHNGIKQYFIYALKAGIFILPATALIVTGSLFFPFITGKNFFFRIVVEILFFLWIIVATIDKNYRPKKSPLLLAVTATIFILFLATIFGENVYRSFWSNYERMEGFIGHLHLFAYFLIVTSVFKKDRDWKFLFYSLLGVSAIISAYGFLQLAGKFAIHQGTDRLDATFGNAAYLAIYIVFHIFLIFLLFLRSKNNWLRGFLVFLSFFEFAVLYYTATRGAFLGFLGGIVVFAIIVSFYSSKRVRYAGIGAIAAIFIFAGLFFIEKDSNFVKQSPMLSRFAELFITDKTTSEYQISRARFTIWSMALEGFKEHPLLGWGPENFNLVFNKYYKPKLYRQEPWFDRSHNILFDWLISSGILGFLAYWSIFGSALFMILRKKVVSKIETAGFTALFAAYSFHNLFVFDNLISYYLFFTILAYIHYRYRTLNNGHQEPKRHSAFVNTEFGIWQYLVITLSFIVIVFSLYFVNLKPILAANQLIKAMVSARTNSDADAVSENFKKVFSYNTFGNAEAREQLSAYASNVAANSAFREEVKKRTINFAIEEMKKQTENAPDDARYYLFLGSLYKRAGLLQNALDTLNKAKKFSPKKQQIDFEIADIYLIKGDLETAFDILQKTYDLAPGYRQTVNNLAIVAILSGKTDYAEKLIFDHYGERIVPNKQLVNAYAKVGNFERVKEIWQKFIEEEPGNSQYYVSLAATFVQLEERNKAIEALEKAIELNPQFKEQGEYYIKEIRAGRNP
jgi:putative inorganic carbon (HCO3(-)) transporter